MRKLSASDFLAFRVTVTRGPGIPGGLCLCPPCTCELGWTTRVGCSLPKTFLSWKEKYLFIVLTMAGETNGCGSIICGLGRHRLAFRWQFWVINSCLHAPVAARGCSGGRFKVKLCLDRPASGTVPNVMGVPFWCADNG